MNKELLKSMIHCLINDKEEQATLDFHQYVAPKMLSVVESEDDDFAKWKADVLAKHADVASKIKFKGRVEQGHDTVSAEIPGEDRSYGVWDGDKKAGTVLESTQGRIKELKAKGYYVEEIDDSGWKGLFRWMNDKTGEFQQEDPYVTATEAWDSCNDFDRENS